MRRNGLGSRGFTLVDLVFGVAGCTMLLFAAAGFVDQPLAPAAGQPEEPEGEAAPADPEKPRWVGPRRPWTSRLQIRDTANQRGIGQALVIFAQNNQDQYPLPSRLDKADHTVKADDPKQKDDTKNIMSVLVYGGFFGPEIAVSPAELNPDIKRDSDYEFSEPKGASDPRNALWDPRFKGPPSAGYQGCREEDPGNFSFAHVPPIGGRSKMWFNTFLSTEAVLSTRGPWYELAGDGATGTWKVSEGAAPGAMANARAAGRKGTESVTLFKRGELISWEGNVVFNDSHAEFHRTPTPESLPFTFAGLEPEARRRHPDHLFVNENDLTRAPEALTLEGESARNTNNYLRSYANVRRPVGEWIDLTGAWFAD